MVVNSQKILYKFIQIHSNLKCDYISYNYKLADNFIRKI